MSLRALRRQWTILGERDPYWAIITADGKQNNQWDVDEFFSTGVAEVERVIRYVETKRPLARRRVLDFGCGAGRLSQAFAPHFESVVGVDISPPMIDLARRHNRHPERVEYVLNERADLAIFPPDSFDFIYSNMTLQHMRPRLCRGYLQEMLRVLAPDGALLFQLPTGPLRQGNWRRERALQLLYREFWWLFRRPHPYLEMYGMPEKRVTAVIERSGGRVLDVVENENAGLGWHSLSYLVIATHKGKER